MKTTIRFALGWWLFAAAGLAAAGDRFDPATSAGAIAPFIDEQTIAVSRVDLSRFEVDPCADLLFRLIPEPAVDEAQARAMANRAQAVLLGAGCKEVYAVFRLADLPRQAPFLVVPSAEKLDAAKLIAVLPAPRPPAPPIEVKRWGPVLLIGRGQALARLKHLTPDARPELAEAFEAAGGHGPEVGPAAQVLLLPTAVHRRVIEEMMPELPDAIGGGPSTVLTHGLLWAAIGINGPPDLSVEITVQSEDDAAAAAFARKLAEGVRLVARQPAARQGLRKFDQAAALLSPRVKGDRVTLTLGERDGSIQKLLAALSPPIERARSRTWRRDTMRNLKFIGLAMHNWYDVHKRLPAAANFDPAGKPLLSWRVHILPFLDQQKLYEQFHLDEPWDSEHNRKLIERMPDVYRSPASQVAGEGRTCYVVPVGEATAFPGRRGVEFKEIKDGTSNTIMAVEVDDHHAVTWTRPEDLPWDPGNPAQGLGGLFEGGFNALFCDGAVRFIALPADPKTRRGLFTRAGGEVIDWEKF